MLIEHYFSHLNYIGSVCGIFGFLASLVSIYLFLKYKPIDKKHWEVFKKATPILALFLETGYTGFKKRKKITETEFETINYFLKNNKRNEFQPILDYVEQQKENPSKL